MALGPLVSVDWLLDHVGERDLVVVDCRFALGAPGAGRLAWEEGHIPGAHFMDVDEDLSAPPSVGPSGGGRHPLPEPADFAEACAAAGIGAESTVVAYDEAGEGGAARLWWLLRHFGHAEVAVLDGGLHAWRAAGGPLDDLPPRPWSSGDPFVPRVRRGSFPVVGADELTKKAGRFDVVDARVEPRFRGEMEPIDPVAGHIPGARSVPLGTVAPEGGFLPAAELRERLAASDGRELVAYCGSGITASALVLAAAAAGVEATLYPGSWSDWCARGLPVATGD